MAKSFRNVSISREQYRNVRTMVTEASIATIKGLPTKRLVEIRYTMQRFRQEVTATKDTIPVVNFQYVPAKEQPAKRWAYRKAITETIALCDELLKERNNRVSSLLETPASAEAFQQGAEPAVSEAPALEDQARAEALHAELAGAAIACDEVDDLEEFLAEQYRSLSEQ